MSFKHWPPVNTTEPYWVLPTDASGSVVPENKQYLDLVLQQVKNWLNDSQNAQFTQSIIRFITPIYDPHVPSISGVVDRVKYMMEQEIKTATGDFKDYLDSKNKAQSYQIFKRELVNSVLANGEILVEFHDRYLVDPKKTDEVVHRL